MPRAVVKAGVKETYCQFPIILWSELILTLVEVGP